MNREELIQFIVDGVNKVIPGDTTNGELIRKNLESLSSKEFDAYIRSLARTETNDQKMKRNVLPFYRPNLSKSKYNTVHLYRICEELGYPIEQRLVMTDPITGVQYLTPHKYPCFDVQVGRQAQTISKKRSIPERTQTIDDLTGQPTSTSKGSRISSPEARGLGSRGLDKALLELAHVRGGSTEAYREMTRSIVETGQCTLDQVKGLGHAKSAKTLAAYLNACHIGNNIIPETPIPPKVYGK